MCSISTRPLRHLLVFATLLGFAAPSCAQELWSGFGTEVIDSAVYDVVEYQGELIVTGSFVNIGSRALRHIARWDGSEWLPLGEGLTWDDEPFDPYNVWGSSLLVHEGDLYVGGFFRRAGGSAAPNIARWDGSNWHAVGSGFNGIVHDLTVFRSQVVACGQFTRSGSRSTIRVARLNSGSWFPLEAGLGWPVYSVHAHGDFLYAGGIFAATSTGRPIERLGEWDGQTWRTLAQEINAFDARGLSIQPGVLSLASYQGLLYVGGQFDEIDGDPVKGLAVYDGQRLRSPLPPGFVPEVRHERVQSLAVHAGELIVGGEAEFATDDALLQISRWTGSAFLALGHGVDDYVQTLLSTSEGVIAGGSFTQAGGQFAPALALWESSTVVSAPTFEPGLRVTLEDIEGSAVRLRLSLSRSEPIHVDVFDLRGRHVVQVFSGRPAAGETVIEWDGRNAAGRTVARGRYQLLVTTPRGGSSVGWTRLR